MPKSTESAEQQTYHTNAAYDVKIRTFLIVFKIVVTNNHSINILKYDFLNCCQISNHTHFRFVSN